MKRLVILVLMLALAPCAGLAEGPDKVDPGKAAVIRELLEVTGSFDLGRQMMAQMIELQKQGKTEEQKRRIDLLASRMDLTDLVDEFVIMYDRHFSEEVLRETLKFYKSDAGASMLRQMPALLKESMELGQRWGQRKADELGDELARGSPGE